MGAPQDWMPSDLPQEVKDEIAAKHPMDNHGAAAEAWEYYAATLELGDSGSSGSGGGVIAGGEIQSVTTGSQTITYTTSQAYGSSSSGMNPSTAFARANWHRARARGHNVNVAVGYRWGWDADPMYVWTYDSPSMPETGMAQINLLAGRVGPNDLENY
jgi:hypothetical protein